MGNLAPEVTLVTMKTKIIRSDYPFVEYAIDTTTRQEIYKAKVHIIRHYDGFNETETRIALDKESQKIVDTFLELQRQKHMAELVDLNIELHSLYADIIIERSRSCWYRFIKWMEKR